MRTEDDNRIELHPIPESEAEQMLAGVLAPHRDVLLPPRPDRQSSRLYLYVRSFDPRIIIAGAGYGTPGAPYAEIAKTIYDHTVNVSAEYFLTYMSHPAGLTKNPLVPGYSSLAGCMSSRIRSKNDGFVLTVHPPEALVIDQERDQWEKQLYLLGPVNPLRIENVVSMRSAEERMSDRQAPLDAMSTRSSFEHHGFAFNQPPKEVLNQAHGSKKVHDALLRAILIDGAGAQYNETGFKDIKPLSSTENFKELLDCLYVLKLSQLNIGGHTTVNALAQVNSYIRGDIDINRVENPYVQEALIRIGLNMIKKGVRD